MKKVAAFALLLLIMVPMITGIAVFADSADVTTTAVTSGEAGETTLNGEEESSPKTLSIVIALIMVSAVLAASVIALFKKPED